MPTPTVEQYIQQHCDQSWQNFYALYKDQFEKAPAGQSKHHNFTGGLAVHTAEVIRAMFEIRANLSMNSLLAEQYPELVSTTVCKLVEFTDCDIVVAGFLHDFAKIVQYAQDEMGDWKFVKMNMPQETWTLMVLAQHGIKISEDQTLSLLYAEGGYSHFADIGEPNELARLLHMADIWSSQIICPTLQLPLCARCGKEMKKRNGNRGPFWGCTGYPVCTMTINIEQLVS
jgi:hypothetical protein